jgi:hypothetical protein
LSGKIAILRKIEINKFVESIGADAVTNDDDRAIAFNKKLISDFYRFPLRRHLGVNIDPSAKPLTNIKKVLNAIGFDFTRDENSKKAKGRGEYEIKAISNLKDAIFDAWLKRDFRDNFDHQNAETTVSRRKFPNNNIVSREFAEFAEPELKDDFYQVTENIAAAAIRPMAIEPTAPKSKNAIQWQKGMSAMYQGVDWAIATLGTATAKIVRNGFELWVDIPELAIADKNNLRTT